MTGTPVPKRISTDAALRQREQHDRKSLTGDFVHALRADFEEFGAPTIRLLRATDPAAYLRLVSAMVPKKVEVQTSSTDELSDAELEARIKALAGRYISELSSSPESGFSAEEIGKIVSRTSSQLAYENQITDVSDGSESAPGNWDLESVAPKRMAR